MRKFSGISIKSFRIYKDLREKFLLNNLLVID